MNERERTRAKILGVLIQDARRHAGRTMEACAQALNMTAEEFAGAERGEHILSLPDLEVLAIYLKVPISHFWGNDTVSQEQTPDFATMVSLRQRMIGALLRQARLEAGRSLPELANEIKVDTARIQSYEAGHEPIPLFHLEKLGRYLGVSVAYFSDDQRGPLARHESEQKMQRRFASLPEDLRAFVAEPINISYLETARRLSELDVKKLRSIAEGLLDITF